MTGRQTIADMVTEKQFEGGSARFMHFVGFAFDNHALRGFCSARRDEFAVDFHHTGEAGSLRAAFFQIAECGDVDPQFACAVEHALSRQKIDVMTVDANFDFGWFTHSSLDNFNCIIRTELAA